MTSNELLIGTISLPTYNRYQDNLDKVIEHIKSNSHLDVILIPELFFTGFDYEHMLTAAKFSVRVIKELKRLSTGTMIIVTLIMEEKDSFVNRAVVILNNKIVYKQNKSKLFKLGNEHKEFIAGNSKKVKPFEVNGINYALLICFELRFKELWKQIEGADIVLIPAQWGKARKTHLETLSRALAIMNQCFVVVSNSSSSDMASSSAIITPNGDFVMDDSKTLLESKVNLQDIKKIKRYIDIRE